MRRNSQGLLSLASATQTSAPRGFGRASSSATAARLGLAPAELARQRLDEARRRGGFVAVKASVLAASAVCDELARMEGVAAVNVTASFVAMLKQIVEDAGRPRWETVLAADSADASPAARAGFARLVDATWERLEAHIVALGNGGIVLLHDADAAGPLHRRRRAAREAGGRGQAGGGVPARPVAALPDAVPEGLRRGWTT